MRPLPDRRAAAAAALTLGGALVACAPGGQAPAAPTGPVSTDVAAAGEVTLTVWDQEVRGGQDEQMERLNAAFTAAHPTVRIERVSQSFDDLATTLRLAITDDDAPDVVQANNGRAAMGAFVAAGQLRPLDDYAAVYGWADRFAPDVLRLSSYSADGTVFGAGSLYGLPQVGEVVGVFYSRTALAALGREAPVTWDDVEATLGAAHAAGRTGLQLGNLEGWPAGHVFGPLQGAEVDADDIVALGLGNAGASWTTPGNEAAAARLQGWVEAGYLNDGPNGTDYDAAWQAFASGDGVLCIAGSWLAADLAAAMGEDVGFLVPVAEPGAPPVTTGGTGLPFAVTAASDVPDVAAAYVDFITSDEAMAVLAGTGNLPVNRTAELAPADGLLADVFAAFGEVTGSGSLLPYLDYATPTFGDTLGAALQDLIAGRVTPRAFTVTLQADYAAFVGG